VGAFYRKDWLPKRGKNCCCGAGRLGSKKKANFNPKRSLGTTPEGRTLIFGGGVGGENGRGGVGREDPRLENVILGDGGALS